MRARLPRARRSPSQDPQPAQLGHRLDERAAADGVDQGLARARELARAGAATVPAERVAIERERAFRRAQRFLLVPEHRCGEEVEEAVLAGAGRIRLVKAG